MTTQAAISHRGSDTRDEDGHTGPALIPAMRAGRLDILRAVAYE